MMKWYVAYTRPHAEQLAVINLGNQGFSTYLPRYRKTRRHARRIEEILQPLFPRYIFVQLDLDAQAWRSVNGTRGVVSLVTQGDLPPAVPDLVMEELYARETADGSILLAGPSTKKGDAMKIIDGVLTDLSGIFDYMADNQRAMLLLNLLGQTVRVKVPLQSLSPVT